MTPVADATTIDAQRARCDAAPRSAKPWIALAHMLVAAGRPAEAIMAAEMALAARPGDPTAGGLKLQALAAISATEPTLARLELSAALDPTNAALQLELGETYADLDRPADAERCLKRALALRPAMTAAEAKLGAVYLSVEIDAGAEHHSRRALALQPGHAVASQTLAAVLERRGEAAQAHAVLDAAYRTQSLFFQPAAASRMTVLVLATQDAGNIPYRHIMPPDAYTRLVWYMEHARDDQLADAPAFDLVFNTIGDPDLAGPSQDAVQRFLEGNARPLLNHPDRVARTHRHLTPGLLGDLAGVLVPRTERVEAQEAAAVGLAVVAERRGLAAPLLVRPLGSHGGRGLRLAENADALAEAPRDIGDLYLTQFHDYRSPDGRWRKARVIFIDGRPYPYHLAISDHWMVHYETAGMVGDAGKLAEEARFLADPEAFLGPVGWAAIEAIGRRLKLHYCGVDFAPLPDGRILVFEANATMLTHPEAADGPLAHKNPAVRAIIEAFQAMLGRMASEGRP